jgi:hypothetical protein
MADRQLQRAGDNSQLVQVAGDLVQGGVTYDEANTIAEIQARKVAAEHFAAGEALANERMERLNQRVLQTLQAVERLAAFADPSFQISLKRAQLGAACTDEDADYDMLAQLLSDRATRGDHRKVRAGLDLAIQVVDQLDPVALAGLTVFQAALQWRPVGGTLGQALDTWDRLFSQLPTEHLPPASDAEWLDHLDVLGIVRVSTIGSMIKYDELLSRLVPGLACGGVEAGSEDEASGLAKLHEVGMSLPRIEHELKPGYRRLPWCAPDILELQLAEQAQFTPQQVAVAVDVARDTYKIGQHDAGLRAPLMERVRALPHLGRVPDWWDAIPHAVEVTSVGRVLARANAKRCDLLKMLPALD